MQPQCAQAAIKAFICLEILVKHAAPAAVSAYQAPSANLVTLATLEALKGQGTVMSAPTTALPAQAMMYAQVVGLCGSWRAQSALKRPSLRS